MSKQIKLVPKDAAFVDVGVQPHFECKFNFGCYGEICIGAQFCEKQFSDMSREEKKAMNRARQSCGMGIFFPQKRHL